MFAKLFHPAANRQPTGAQRRLDPGEVAAIRPHFDAEFYADSNADIAGSGLDALAHFCLHGWREGRNPNREFSTAYYLFANPDVAAADQNPFLHWVQTGRAQGLPGRAADAAPEPRAAADYAAAIRPYFDASYYLSENPDVAEAGLDPVDHYCQRGWAEGRNPSTLFSSQFYLEDNADVAASGVNPFWHYLVTGRDEGRRGLPPPSASGPDAVSPELRGWMDAVADAFDATYYLEQHPDVAGAGLDPLLHYFTHGWAEGRDPRPDFSTAFYLERHSDVAEAGINPFWHYVVAGQREGRETRPLAPVAPGTEPTARQRSALVPAQETAPDTVPEAAPPVFADNEADLIRTAFDPLFYLANNSDVAEQGIDPLAHFCAEGWRENRDPCCDFSTRHYLDTNPDVAALGMNPFWHYLATGRNEGRAARHPGGPRVERLRDRAPLDAIVTEWRAGRDGRRPDKLLSVATIQKQLALAAGGMGHLIVAVTHDDHHRVSGGIQFCIQREEALAAGRGIAYLSLYPFQPLPRLAHPDEDPDPLVQLVLAGTGIGCAPMSTVIEAVGNAAAGLSATEFVIHHLLGHAPELVTRLVRAAGTDRCSFWLHDYFSLCPGFTLQRNGLTFCGAPGTGSNACALCLYGKERRDHAARIARLFESLKVDVLAPSEVARDLWAAKFGAPAFSLSVLPHMALNWDRRDTALPQPQGPVSVAFLGTPAEHKGWPEFQDIVRRHATDGRYRFLFLGAGKTPMTGLAHVPVHVTAGDQSAMIDAVCRNQVDIVLHWASWPETFSLSTFEALAGGAAVVTNPGSGNVAATVRAHARGLVLSDRPALDAFFTGDGADTLARDIRTLRATTAPRLTLGEMSLATLMRERAA